MSYSIAGLTFTFVQNDTGGVIQIVTPVIALGVTQLNSYTLNFDPALTVAGAEAMARQIVGLLGL